MKVVVSGTVGVDKKAYLAKVCDLAGKDGRDVLLCNVGDMMYAEAPDIAKGRILDISLKRLQQLRRSVFKDIIAKSHNCDHLIVNTHATFRWRHGLFPAVDFDLMRELSPDMYICLTDSADAVHVRLAEHPIEHSLKDLLVWREEEILGTDMLRRGIDEKVPLYCLARGAQQDTAETFYRLVFEPERKKAYLSFPITHVVDIPQVRSNIDKFRYTMKQALICFDPGDLEEAYLPYYARLAAERGEDFIELAVLGVKTRFDLNDIRQAVKDIESQIYARDFMLIDQSDMIISFIPAAAEGGAILSSGVERELQHAHEAAKEVYVIWRSAARPSVFVTQTATRIFRDCSEALLFFRSRDYIEP
ncbi:MAG: AAA family ATPase [Planctomycetota bacterium]